MIKNPLPKRPNVGSDLVAAAHPNWCYIPCHSNLSTASHKLGTVYEEALSTLKDRALSFEKLSLVSAENQCGLF